MTDPRFDELYELVLSIQAETAALKRLMFDANPKLAEKHQALTDELRKTLLRAWKENRRT